MSLWGPDLNKTFNFLTNSAFHPFLRETVKHSVVVMSIWTVSTASDRLYLETHVQHVDRDSHFLDLRLRYVLITCVALRFWSNWVLIWKLKVMTVTSKRDCASGMMPHAHNPSTQTPMRRNATNLRPCGIHRQFKEK